MADRGCVGCCRVASGDGDVFGQDFCIDRDSLLLD